jgi:thioredoxin reductase (NADPH)
MSENKYDLMILGSGPAGLTAALFRQRLGLQVIVFGDIPGGSTYMIHHLANFPGFMEETSGTQFGTMTFQQAQSEGAFFTMTRLKRLSHEEDTFVGVDDDGHQHVASCAIVATGRVPKRLAVANVNIPGVHFCSICDGPLYRGKNAILAVVGNDNTAGQHALTLARVADKVLLISHRDSIAMDAAHKKMIEKHKNIELLLNTEVTAYKGTGTINGVKLLSEDGKDRELPIDGIFLAIGWRPNTKMLDLQVEKTPDGYLKADQHLMTSFPGLFTAGDVRETDMWQVLTACADGARAAKYAAEFIEKIQIF